MSVNFQFVALDKSNFESYSALTDEGLSDCNARWLVADARPGFPCRVSLQNAEIGERVLAISYCFQNADSPYRASGPIFVREKAETANPPVNEVPEMLVTSLLSVRAYNAENMLVAAEVVEGDKLESVITSQFSEESVDYLHIHYAKQGCFNSVVRRA
jgi:hypothetical protein